MTETGQVPECRDDGHGDQKRHAPQGLKRLCHPPEGALLVVLWHNNVWNSSRPA